MAKSEYHNIYEFFLGSKRNTTGQDIVLHWSNGKEHRIKEGEIIWLPKQLESLRAAQDPRTEILFMGGALGGSKSHALRGIAAIRLIEMSQYRGQGLVPDEPIKGAIFSENYPVLKNRHIDTIRSWPKWLGKWYAADKEFRFADEFGGPILSCLNLDKVEKYASAQFAISAIDESTFNVEQTITTVQSRTRWPGLSPVMLLASNPGRVGHAYHKKRFVVEKTRDPGVVFIPSLLKDNPFLSLDPKYLRTLDRLPKKLREAWVNGSWDQFEGQYFPDLSDDVHFIRPFRIPQEWMRYRVIDHGFKHPAAVLWGAVDPDGNLYCYMTYESLETTAEVNKRHIADISSDWRVNWGLPSGVDRPERYIATIGDPALKRIDGSALGTKTPWEIYNSTTDGIGSFNVVAADRDRIEGWQALQEAFHYEIDSDASERESMTVYRTKPRIYIFDTPTQTAYLGERGVHSGNALWEELNGLVYDEKKAEDAEKSKGYYGIGEGDDLPECLRYLWTMTGKTDLKSVAEREMDRARQEFERMGLIRSDDYNKTGIEHIPPEVRERILAGTWL